ncbi:MAG: hypothetical protein Q8Q09_17790 [Deltaproteobacteria bacterium]|nr:hypothetical protein [Deltaproteobacteria bacterium]
MSELFASAKRLTAPQRKKAAQQIEDLARVEQLLLGLVQRGLRALDTMDLADVRAQSKRMIDGDLRGVSQELLRFGAAIEAAKSDDRAMHHAVAQTTRLWTLVRRGLRLLRAHVAGETSPEKHALWLETRLGRALRVSELESLGSVLRDRLLYELAHTRFSDAVIATRTHQSWLVDVHSGEVFLRWSSLPKSALRSAGASLHGPLESMIRLPQLALHDSPLCNRRVRFTESDEGIEFAPRGREQTAQIHAHAQSIAQAHSALCGQLRDGLAPGSAVFLLALERAGIAPNGDLAVVDREQRPLRIARRYASVSTHENARLVASRVESAKHAAMLARVWVDPATHTLRCEPLALLLDDEHLRLEPPTWLL